MGEEKSSKAENPPTDGKVSPKEMVKPEIGTSITSPGETYRKADRWHPDDHSFPKFSFSPQGEPEA